MPTTAVAKAADEKGSAAVAAAIGPAACTSLACVSQLLAAACIHVAFGLALVAVPVAASTPAAATGPADQPDAAPSVLVPPG